MQLVAKYTNGSRAAEVYQVSPTLYMVECYTSGQLVNKTTYGSLDTAKFVADNYTIDNGGSQQLLNEDA